MTTTPDPITTAPFGRVIAEADKIVEGQAARIAELEATIEKLKAERDDLEKEAERLKADLEKANRYVKVKLPPARSSGRTLTDSFNSYEVERQAAEITRLTSQLDLYKAALEGISEVDDDGFTSDGHERCAERAAMALSQAASQCIKDRQAKGEAS